MSWDQYAQGQGEPPQDQPQWVTPEDPYGQQQPGNAYPGQTAPYPQQGGYPGQSYPTQQFPQDPYGQQPYGGWPGYPPPQPPKKNRTAVIVSSTVGAVIVVAAVAVFVAHNSNSNGSNSANGTSHSPSVAADNTPSTPASSVPETPTSFTLPQSAGPLNLLDNADVRSRTTQMKQKLADNTDYPSPVIGFYGLNGSSQYSVWMQAQPTADTPDIASAVQSDGADDVLGQIVQGAQMDNATTRDPGQLGGAVQCGELAVSGTTVNSCIWVDGVSFGAVYALNTTPLSDVFTYEQDLRQSAELG